MLSHKGQLFRVHLNENYFFSAEQQNNPVIPKDFNVLLKQAKKVKNDYLITLIWYNKLAK
ncbi:hypothetical protein CRM88_12650 [Lactococcus lactis]|nr:hypothetical protein B8W94_03820 [Lactococcus lactis]PEN17737.1 hypothetical protein CRM88_12650 [Lactococcus lactis]